MRPERNTMSPIIWGMLFMLLAALGGALVISQASKSRTDLPILWQVPEFEFTERSSQPFGLDDMKGKISVVDFIFTNCQSICPTMSGEMAGLYEYYSESDLVQFVSISVDPARDTLETLNAYAESFGVDDDRWVFLRAPIEEVTRLCEDGFKLPAGDLPMGHSNRFVLVDQNGYIRSYHDSFDQNEIEELKANIRILARSN